MTVSRTDEADAQRAAYDLATRTDIEHERGRGGSCRACGQRYPCPAAMSARTILRSILGPDIDLHRDVGIDSDRRRVHRGRPSWSWLIPWERGD